MPLQPYSMHIQCLSPCFCQQVVIIIGMKRSDFGITSLITENYELCLYLAYLRPTMTLVVYTQIMRGTLSIKFSINHRCNQCVPDFIYAAWWVVFVVNSSFFSDSAVYVREPCTQVNSFLLSATMCDNPLVCNLIYIKKRCVFRIEKP